MPKNKEELKDFPVYQIYRTENAPEQVKDEERLRLQWKDVLAIIIAIYRIFIPWTLAIAGIYALLLLIFDLVF